jgi:hypothetical protein
MSCLDCTRLIAECKRVEGVRATALRNLQTRIATSPKHAYTKLKAKVFQAELELDVARLKLAQHERSHNEIAVGAG